MTAPRAPLPFAVVLNPHAGRGLALRLWPRLERELRVRRVEFEVVMAGNAKGALARVQALPALQPVLAVGGDGTVSALLPALAGTGRPLGIVPLGSGNDFAGMLGLKSGDFRAALDRLSRAPQPVDALCARVLGHDRWLLNGLGMGFDAQVAALMGEAPSRLSGFSRYLYSALRGVRELRTGEVEVTLGGAVAYKGPSCLVAVMNGARYGGGFRISPESRVNDGQLDVILGTRLTRLQLLRLMGMVLRGAHLDDPRVRCWRGSEVQVRWARPMHAHLDGDLSGELTELRARVRPGAVLLY